MNKEINQKISQFLDDELDHTELDNFLHNLKKQPELKSKMNRYQVVTQVMKMDQAVMANGSFLDNISLQLEQEPHHFLPQRRKRQSTVWQKTSLAIAASVVGVAVIISQQGTMQTTTQAQQIVLAQPVAEKQEVIVVANNPQPTQHERLKAYLQAHNDDLYTHGSLNIHPLARVASYGQD